MRFTRGDRALTREELLPTFGQGTAADIPVFGFSCTLAKLDAFYVARGARRVLHFARHCRSGGEGQAAPDLVRLACQELNVAPSEAWMVGDSRFDRAAAQSAGVFFIGLGLDGDRRIERLAEL